MYDEKSMLSMCSTVRRENLCLDFFHIILLNTLLTIIIILEMCTIVYNIGTTQQKKR